MALTKRYTNEIGPTYPQSVTYAAALSINLGVSTTVKVTLTGNVTSCVLTNLPHGLVTFIITQDGTGSRTWTWPANVKGGMTIGATASLSSVQSFISDGVNLYAHTPGVTNQ